MTASRPDRSRRARLERWRGGAAPFVLSAWLVATLALAGPATLRTARDPVPILAYYYIWFDAGSWGRAKTDYPLLGRYESGAPAVMEEHVRLAQEAGIDGFIVSWKSTETLDARLRALMEVAAARDFALWIIYQGLDVRREPLPIERVDADLERFASAFADHPAFGTGDRPVVIWSGTWRFSASDVRSVVGAFRDRLAILATERSVDGYLRLAATVDGNAYYWASVDPDTFPGYQDKLDAMGRAVHDHGGVWVAPAAPGFDARALGGTTVVERHDGRTLARQLDAALRSSPDAIGLISWNEFSENSHVEPSERYGTTALETLASRRIEAPARLFDFDSSAPGTTGNGHLIGPILVALGAVLIGLSLAVLVARGRGSAAMPRPVPGAAPKEEEP